MAKVDDRVAELRELPVEDRIRVMNAAMQSLHPSRAERDKRWGAEAKRRLLEFLAGRIEAKPGEEVFARLPAKYSK